MKRLLCVIGALVCGLVLTSAMMLVLPLAIRPAFADPGVLYVAPGGNCGEAEPCYSTVQAAVDAAAELDTIKVAAGTYTDVQNIPTLNTSTFTATQVVAITKSVTIQGGYTPADWNTFDPDANITVLDAQGQGRVVFVPTGGCTIEGLHITGGDAAGLGGHVPSYTGDVGGGVCVNNAPTTLRYNNIYSNTADFGGGVYMYYRLASLYANTIADNVANRMGGGMYLYSSPFPQFWGIAEIRGNTIVRNWAGQFDGGGVYLDWGEVTLVDNTIASNYAVYGGGIHVYEGDVNISGNMMVSNTAKRSGGAVYLRTLGDVTLSGNTLAGNDTTDVHVSAGGGALSMNHSRAMLSNNIIADNDTNAQGSGLRLYGSSAHLVHTTIAGNSGGDGSGVYLTGGSEALFTNTILVSHTVGITVTAGSTATLEGTLWGSSAWANGTDWGGPGTLLTGTVNLWGDPAFVGAGDYHLTAGSAAIDVGVDAGVTDDIDDHVRPFGAGPDLGADEHASSGTSVSPGGGGHLMAVSGGLTTTVDIPAGAVTQTTDFVYSAQAPPVYPDPPDQAFAGHAFALDAYDGDTLLPGFTFSVPVTITIHYADGDVAGVDETTLELWYWDGSAWQGAGCGPHDRHPGENWLGVPVCHLSEFALFGMERLVYLPLVLRSG